MTVLYTKYKAENNLFIYNHLIHLLNMVWKST